MATDKLYSLVCWVRAAENGDTGLEELLKKANIGSLEELNGADNQLVALIFTEIKEKLVVLCSLLLQSKGKKILLDHKGTGCLWKYGNCLTYGLISSGFKDFAQLESHLVTLWSLYAALLPLFPSVTADLFLCNVISVLLDNVYAKPNEISTQLEGILMKIQPNLDKTKAIVDKWDATADPTQQVQLGEITTDECVLVDNGLKGYEEALRELIKATSGTKINLSKMALLEKYVNFLCLPEHTVALIDNVEEMMGMVDVRVRQTFLRILKASVESLSLEDRQLVMTYYYNKFGVINIADSYGKDRFDAELNSVVNRIVNNKDGSDVAIDKAGSTLANNLYWPFLISGKRVLWRLFLLAQDAPATVPLIVRAFVDLRPALNIITEDSDKVSKWPLVLVGLKRLLDQTGLTGKGTENLTKFVLALVDNSLVDANAFVKVCLLPGLAQNKSIEWAMASLTHLNALISPDRKLNLVEWTNYLTGVESNAKCEDHWGSADAEKPETQVAFSDGEKLGLNPSPLYLLIFQLFGSASLRDTLLKCPHFAFPLQDICLKTIACIAASLARSKFEMSEKGLNAVILAAEKIHWGLRLYTTQLLKSQAHIPKHKVPACLKSTLKLDSQLYDTFQCLESHSTVICTLESLAECCAVSGEVLELLKKDFDRRVLAEHQNEIVAHLVIAVANIIPMQRLNAWRSILGMIEFFEEILRDNQMTVYSSHSARQLNEGLQVVGPILILSEAIIYRLSDAAKTNDSSTQHMINCFALMAKERCQQLSEQDVTIPDATKSVALLAVWTSTCQVTKFLRDSFARTMGVANSLLPTKAEFSKLQELLNDILSMMTKMVKELTPDCIDTIAEEVKVFPDGTLKSKIEGRIASLKP